MREKKKSHSLEILPKSSPSVERLKKGVGAIHSSGNLTLVQRKLANVLLYSAYDNLLSKRTHTIPVPIMCAMLGWEASNRIDHLKEALAALQETRIEFNLREDGQDVWESMTMLSYAHIKNGVCTWRYDEALAEKLYDPAMFAMINLQVQRRIDSAYALNLYENCLRYKDTNTGSTGLWTLKFFREIVGATASYCDDFRLLNRKVIKPALEKINEVSDIVVSVEYERKMRSVAALKFHVREKTEDEKMAMPTALPGMSFPESTDEYQEIRNAPAFQALRKHGITERLAFAWIRERGEQAMLDLVAYTEERDANKQIKTNTGAYMKGLIQAGAELGKSDYQTQKEAVIHSKEAQGMAEKNKEQLKALEEKYRKHLHLSALKALTIEERNAHTEAWFNTPKGAGKELDYDAKTGLFRDGVNSANFNYTYLIDVLARPYTQSAFKAWLEKAEKINPKKFGL